MATESPPGIFANIKQRWDMYMGLREAWVVAFNFYVGALWRDIREANFAALLRPSQISDKSFAMWWMTLSHHFVRHEEGSTVPALVGSAHGLVLDLGAGTGNQLPRFDKSKIKHIYGIESNQIFAPALDAKIKATGFQGLYTPVICRVEDAEVELAQLGVAPGTVDCIVSIQLFCSVKNLETVIRQLHRLLRPGGELIFWEHQRNEVDFITRRVQGLWNLFWTPLVGGCRLNQRTREILLRAADWEVIDLGVDEGPRDLMPRVWGRLRKA